MKMLILADAAAWHTERYVSELRRQGHIVFLASMQAGPQVDYQLPLSRYGAAVSYMSHVKKIKALIDELHPEVVNAHFASAYGVMAARCRRRFGDCGAYWPLTVWGSDILISPAKSYLHRRRVQYALQSADVILADSTYLSSKTKELTDIPLETILWGVERRYVADDATLIQKAKLSGSEDDKRQLKLLAPRPHRELYANESLLVSLAPLLKSGKATLTINSSGNLFERFLALAKSLGIRDTITVYQPCSRDEYLELLKAHDIYLSAAMSDSSPVSLIEALALGVFPVSAAHPGLSDLISTELKRFSSYEPETDDGPLTVIKRILELSKEERESMLFCNRDVTLRKGIYEDNISATAALFERGVLAAGKGAN